MKTENKTKALITIIEKTKPNLKWNLKWDLNWDLNYVCKTPQHVDSLYFKDLFQEFEFGWFTYFYLQIQVYPSLLGKMTRLELETDITV